MSVVSELSFRWKLIIYRLALFSLCLKIMNEENMLFNQLGFSLITLIHWKNWSFILHVSLFFYIDRINFPQKRERKRTSKNWRKYGVHALLHRNLWILTQNVTKKVEILVFKLIEYILKEKCKYVWWFLSYIVYTLCIKVTGKWTT